MREREKALDLLSKVNGQPVTIESWMNTSRGAKEDLKRHANLIVREVITSLQVSTGPLELCDLDRHELSKDFKYWTRVNRVIAEL